MYIKIEISYLGNHPAGGHVNPIANTINKTNKKRLNFEVHCMKRRNSILSEKGLPVVTTR